MSHQNFDQKDLEANSSLNWILVFFVFLGIMKFYYWTSMQITVILFPTYQYHQVVTLGYRIGLLVRFIPILLFYWLNRHNLKKYLISKDISNSLQLFFFFNIFFLLFSLYTALITPPVPPVIKILPLNEWPENLISSIYYSVVEELEFRSIMLIQITIFLKDFYNSKDPEMQAMIFIIIWFGPIYHFHHVLSGNITNYIVANIFGIVATYLTVKKQNVIPSIFLHVFVNFYFLLFI